MSVKNLFYLYFIALVLFSCKNKQVENQEKEVNVLMNKINGLKDSLMVNEMDSLLEMRLAATTLLIRVKSTYSPKKIDLTFGKKVEDFKQLQRELKEKKKNGKRNLPGDYVLLNKLIQEELVALTNLKSDIENGMGDHEKYDEYILFEKKKYTTITELYKGYIKGKKEFIPRFYKGYRELEDALNAWEENNFVHKTTQKS